MSKEREDRFDPSQPTLIVQCGNTKRKHRPMDRDVLVLGRAPGCDVGLEAPDVAAVHCVIVRSAAGWCVRDCTGKGATRLNGRSVQDAALADEDVLQVGSFSFALHLPPDHQPPAGGEATPGVPALRRAERSRHNLARLALRLRGRLSELERAAVERADRQLAARQEELDRQTEELRVLQRDVDARFAQLKETAQELTAREATLDERRLQFEAAQQASAEACQARCRAVEESHGRTLAAKEGAFLASTAAASRDLETRARELGFYAVHLRRQRQRLNEHEESLTARWEEWLREQQEASVAHTRQSEKIAREEALLRDQRSEIVRLMGEMRQMRQKPDPQIEALRGENEELQRGLVERDAAVAAARHEAEELRGRLAAREGDADAAGSLQRFAVELDTGRRILDEQIRGLQGRFADLEQAAREAEAHIAGERGRMVREREELERLRGELWPGEARSPGSETVVDMPSPLRHLPELTADGPEAPRQASAAPE